MGKGFCIDRGNRKDIEEYTRKGCDLYYFCSGTWKLSTRGDKRDRRKED